MSLPDNRRDAKLNGDKFYFTGKPCVNGHIDKRQTSNGCCYTCSKEKSSNYSKNNRDKINQRKLINYHSDVEKSRSKNRDYYRRNSVLVNKNNKKYFDKNRSKLNEYKLKWCKNKYKTDPNFKLMSHMRKTLIRLLKYTGEKKTRRTTDMMGYTTEQLKARIELLFVDGMSWSNYGDWHIDHIIPISAWVKSGVNDPKVINALDNLQPLWADDNMSKGDKILC